VATDGARPRDFRGGPMTTAPMNPLAGPAGPGKYSTRTDNLEMGSIAYGEGVETQAIKSGAPLAATPNVRPQPVTELYAPTERPEEPITAGINRGAGPGSEALMMNQMQQNDKDIVAKYLPSLSSMASTQDAPESFRAFVSFLQGSL
jgi:hypothetical protein